MNVLPEGTGIKLLRPRPKQCCYSKNGPSLPLGEASRPDYAGSEYGRESDYGEYDRPSSWGYSAAGRRSEGGAFSGESGILVRLGDADLDLADGEDIRGRRVFDQDGNDIGDVDDLIIDQRQRRVRFLHVTSGGFLGIGATMMLIPVEAITRVTRDGIEISHRVGRGLGAARYSPKLIDRRSEWREYEGYSTTGRRRGRGPRNYKRSDDRIREDINDRLSDQSNLDASDVEVSVNNAEVVLSGAVNSRREKRLAEDIAENVLGVTNVENRIRVRATALTTPEGTYAPARAAGTIQTPGTDTAAEASRASRGKSTGT